jgi:hypothetical protein
MRERLAGSRLMDTASLARQLEGIYRQVAEDRAASSG